MHGFSMQQKEMLVFPSGLFYLIACIVFLTTPNELLACYVDKIEVPTRIGFGVGILDFNVDLAVIAW